MKASSKIRISRAIFSSLLPLLLAGCAQVGAVRAPTAGLPQPVRNLHAQRRGPQIALSFPAPTATSDGYAYDRAKFGALRYQACLWPGIEKGTAPAPAARPAPGAGIAVAPQVPSRKPPQPGIHGRFRVPSGALMPSCPQLIQVSGGAVRPPAQANRGPALRGGPRLSMVRARLDVNDIAAKTPVATLALAAEGEAGEWAGWSNPVVVPLTSVAPPPQLQTIQLLPGGVRLSWHPASARGSVLVYRQSGAASPQLVAQLPPSAASYVDHTVAWDHNYVYWLRSAAGSGAARAESADSRHLAIYTADVFPPPVPTGLQVVPAASGGGVDLSWNAVVAPDLAGYNVYRQLPGSSAWQRRNAAPLPTPVFHDQLPAAVTAARYAVTAIDAAGNESRRSTPVSVP